MPNDVTTNLTFVAKGRGFAKLRDDQGRLNETIEKGHKGQKRGFDEARKSASTFEQSMARAMRAVSGNRSAMRELRSLGKHFDDLAKKISRVEESLKKADQARGAFFQGLSQGLGAGEFLQRGPGMGRQIAGRMVGRAGRAAFTGTAGAMFGGAGSLVQAAQSLPGGGFLAQPMQRAMSFAGGALQLQRQQLQALPMLGGAPLAQRVAQRRGQILSPEELTQRSMTPEVMAAMERGRAERGINLGVVGGNRQKFTASGAPIIDLGRIGGDPSKGKIPPDPGQQALMAERGRLVDEQRGRIRAGGQVREDFFGGIRRAGAQLGAMDVTQSNQFAAQLAAAGGTTDPRQMMRTGVAAQTAFGIGADTSGAFLRAGRRGGLAGGGGGETALVDAISGALRLGLEGSELTSYMQEMAQGISQFSQTGMPINPRSIASMAASTSAMGLGATRGQRVSQGLFAAGQSLAQKGPQDAVDLLMLQQAGFKGGGTDELLESMIKLEEQGIGGKGAQNLIQTLSRAGGGGAGGVFAVQRGLAKKGINVGLGEAQRLSTADPQEVSAILAEKKRSATAKSPKEIQDLARLMVSDFAPQVKRQADITNEQVKIGRNMIPTMQNLEVSTTRLAETFEQTAAPQLTELTNRLAEGSERLQELVTLLRENGLMSMVGNLLRGP